MSKTQKAISTSLARAAIETDTQFKSVMPPIYVSSTYAFNGFRQMGKYDYCRSGNPTRDALADALAEIEHGAGAVVTCSGMAALLTAFHLADQGDLIIAPHDCYGGTYRQLTSLAEKGFIEVAFVDQTDKKALDAALARKPKLILIETPSNPLLRIVDVKAVAEKAKAAGATVLADNTFLSPVLQNPIDLGVDIVIHSTTKYINGHSDVVGGAVISATPELHEKMAWWANNLGVTGAPLDSFLTLRGLRTIELRVRQQEQNAAEIAKALQAHQAVKKVNYPGLENHPGHDIAKAQQKGFGSMLSFEIDGDEDKVRKFLEGLELFSLAESLGGTESLVAHPCSMTHLSMGDKACAEAGISQQLIRLSIGLEDADELIEDLDQALSK